MKSWSRRMRPGPIGLDLGANGIKMIQFADHGAEPVVQAAASYPLPPALEDADARRTATEQAVADALRRHPFQGRDVVTALGFGEFQMKNIRLPRMPPEERAGAIEFEARERFALGDQAAQIRHLVAGEVRHGNELKEEILVFAAPDALVYARLAMLERLRLRPVALDLAPFAVARCFFRFMRRTADAQAVNIFLDVGRRGTAIVLTHGTEVSFLKLIDLGGEHLDEAVGKALSISAEKANDLRVCVMREKTGRRAADRAGLPEDIRSAVTDATRPVVERIARDVQLFLRYFAVTFRGQRPQSLTVVGGEAHEPLLLPVLAESSDVPCTLGDPLRGIAGGAEVVAADCRPYQSAWAVAGGLALRGTRWLRHAEGPVTPRTVTVGG